MSSNAFNYKRILVAVAALAVLIALLILGRNAALIKMAENKIREDSFSTAKDFLSDARGEKAEVLTGYVDLRMEINRKYPELLADFDVETINMWKKTAEGFLVHRDLFSEDTYDKVYGLARTLKTISSAENYYQSMRKDVLDMMDVFSEINRLYTKDKSGNNISFTVSGELKKTERWRRINTKLEEFSSKLPTGERIYLLIYLTKETRGECDDIEEAMNVVLDSGYKKSDSVRLSGDAKKTFPGVTNGNGIKVNVANKEDYEQYMHFAISQSLAETLAEYYIDT